MSEHASKASFQVPYLHGLASAIGAPSTQPELSESC